MRKLYEVASAVMTFVVGLVVLAFALGMGGCTKLDRLSCDELVQRANESSYEAAFVPNSVMHKECMTEMRRARRIDRLATFLSVSID